MKLSRRSSGCQKSALISTMVLRPISANPANFPQVPPGPRPMPKPGPIHRPATHQARASVAGAIAVGLVASVVFASGMSSEPSFVDEWAYLSQTYYADLWLAGNADHPA